MEKTEARPDAERMKWCKGIALGGAAAFITSLLLLLAMAWGICSGRIALGQESGGVAAITFLAALIGSMLAVRLSGLHGLLPGAAVGAVLCLLQLIVGVLLTEGPVLCGQSAAVDVCALTGGLVGSLLLSRQKGRRKRRRSR